MDKDEDDDAAGEATNLKHDLALQRLLKESHLLDPSTFSTTAAATTSESSSESKAGKSRLQALDLRLQGLGAKQAASEQKKMPLAHRKGIAEKAARKETRRRAEATENGVILERVAKGAQKGVGRKEGKRERSMATPGVGKFRGGTLMVSKRDVRAIEGGGGKGKGKGVGRR